MKIKHTLSRAGLLTALTLILVPGQITGAAEADAEKPVLSRIPHLKTFMEAKELQARQDAEKAGEKVDPEIWNFFEAARTENWKEALQMWKRLSRRSGQYQGSTKTDPTIRNCAWPPVLEVDMVVEAFYKGEPKYMELFGRGIVDSIPRGSIFFGGTDPGRTLPTAFCKAHAKGDPIYVLTQNALADGSYLEYLRRMFTGKIYVPSGADSQTAFQDYLADAQKRLEHDRKNSNEPRQLKPGEDVKVVDNKVQVSGQIAVMSINALLTKIIFDKNPDKEFYVEESFPLDWMYPHLTPHGWIMKINRKPLDRIPEEALRKDHEFWSKEVGKMLGPWLTNETSVKDVCAFAQKVFSDRDLEGFKGDPDFVENEYACKSFSKLRSSIAGSYAWRLQRTKTPEEQKALLKEADFAFRQAFALCPYSPEGVFRYINFLLAAGRIEDGLILAETARKLDPGNGQYQNLCEELKRMQQMNKK